MKDFLYSTTFDLVTPDGVVRKITSINDREAIAEVFIDDIASNFVGFDIPTDFLSFNFKSTLAQLGLNGIGKEYVLYRKERSAEVKVHITATGSLAREMLLLLRPGVYIGKLFAADERRHVKNPDYLKRMFNRFDRQGRPLLSFGERYGSNDISFETINGYAITFIELKNGKMGYDPQIKGILPLLERALEAGMPIRSLLRLHQRWLEGEKKILKPDEMLLVCTPPLHIRTVFARVFNPKLPPGFEHTAANILQPDTLASGDIYEFFGRSSEEITRIPLEFFTLDPLREYIFFKDRDQLQQSLESPEIIFNIFKTAPQPKELKTSLFVVKGTQIPRLKSEDWISRDIPITPLSSIVDPIKHASLIQEYIEKQPCYPILQAIENEWITSQGVLFTRYFPSPLLKSMLLSYYVRPILKRVYFQIPSLSYNYYFSQEDRGLLNDLTWFDIPVFWADETSNSILQYIKRPGKTSGMFVPLDRIDTFRKATFIGVYGSNLLSGHFESELKKMLQGLLAMRELVDHPLLNKNTPLALVTGGGPGAMEVGNRMAKELEILSCAHVVDFSPRDDVVFHEQKQNPYIEAKMTYRLDQLIERQAVFFLDFPIFVMGGIGTDFEYSLEEVRHKVGARPFGPIILFGQPEYWREKITSRYQSNVKSGTIKGSEWVSNSFFCIQNAEQGLKVLKQFFEGNLPIGKQYPPSEEGFVIVD